MKLSTEAEEFRPLCREVEQVLADVEGLRGLVMRLLVGDSAPSPKAGEPLRRGQESSPAFYLKDDNAILVVPTNGFASRAFRHQVAVVVHEIAHAFAERVLKRQDWRNDIEADIRACRWGVLDDLVEDRRRSSPEYADILEKLRVTTDDEVREEAVAYRNRLIIGPKRRST